MTDLQTTYRGHLLRYGENSDEWYCGDLGYSNSSLAKVKARVDKMYLDLRKKAAVPCFELSTYGRFQRTESRITEYVKPIEERDRSTNQYVVAGHKVAVVAKRAGNDKLSRREAKLDELMPDTPEAHAAFAEAAKASEAVKAAEAAFRRAVERIPRLSIGDIAELVRIKSTEAEGQAGRSAEEG